MDQAASTCQEKVHYYCGFNYRECRPRLHAGLSHRFWFQLLPREEERCGVLVSKFQIHVQPKLMLHG